MTSLINLSVFFVLFTNGAIGRFLPAEIFRNIPNRNDNGVRPEKCSCEWRFYQHYEAKGCHVVQTDSCGCPTNYLCSSMKHSDSQSNVCVYESVEYKVGEKIKLADKCQVCRCADGMTPRVECRQRECPQLDAVEGKNCHLVYEENKCCPSRYECIGDAPENTAESPAVTCVYKNVTYPLGAKIYPPDDPCLICECKGGWNGADNSSCYQQECVFERKKHLLDAGCIPIYHERRCCPIEYFCPEDLHYSSMGLRELETENSTEDGGSCIFGENAYEVGAELSLNNSCVKCTCQVPPDFTCVHKSCSLPPSAENCVEIRSADKCCPTYDCLLGDSSITETSETEESDRETFETEEGDRETSETEEGDRETSEIEEGDKETSETEEGDRETSETEEGDRETSEIEEGDRETSEIEEISETEGSDRETSEIEGDKEISEAEKGDRETSETEEGGNETSSTELDVETFTTEESFMKTTEGPCPTPLCADDACRIEIPPGHKCPTCVCEESREKNDFEPLESLSEQGYMENSNETHNAKEGTETHPTADDTENELLSDLFIEKLAHRNSSLENLDDRGPRMRDSETELQSEERVFPVTEEYFEQFQSHGAEDVGNHLAPSELREKRSENMLTAEIQTQQSQQQWNVFQADEDEIETSETNERESEFPDGSNEGFDEMKVFGSKRHARPSAVTIVELEDQDFNNVIWTSTVPGCPTPLCADSSCRIGIPQGHRCPTCICKKARQP